MDNEEPSQARPGTGSGAALEKAIAEVYDAIYGLQRGEVVYQMLTDPDVVSRLLKVLNTFRARFRPDDASFALLCDRLAEVSRILNEL